MTAEMLQDTLNMFLFLAVELTLLFLAISYLVGVLQYYIPPSKIEQILSSKKGRGYLIAGFLGGDNAILLLLDDPLLKRLA
ncbi:hypothetical protein TUM4644_34730 [Shewanella colwelliana]|nr:hypothetical protein TUM4644_34730 [Shewanella colwelliana]